MNRYMRHRARKLLVQALYQHLVTGDDAKTLLAQFLADLNEKKVDAEYFKELLVGCLTQKEMLEAKLQQFLEYPLAKVTLVERAVLLIAAYELTFNLELSYRIIIDEALEIDKTFGTAEGYRLINGILDRLAAQERASEHGAEPLSD